MRVCSVTSHKGFTLLELIIVMGILSMLSVIMFRTYTSISQIAIRTQEQQRVFQEVLSFSQMLQNVADQSVLDTGYYASGSTASGGVGGVGSDGFVSVLALTGTQGAVRFFASGQCERALWTGKYHECIVYMQKNDRNIPLTVGSLVTFGSFGFVIPSLAGAEEHGFQLRMEAYSPRFGSDWFNAVKLPVQQFFTLP